jgi:hypothetical protein
VAVDRVYDHGGPDESAVVPHLGAPVSGEEVRSDAEQPWPGTAVRELETATGVERDEERL